jgi:N6-adenosine-specific RNA methylase IME4
MGRAPDGDARYRTIVADPPWPMPRTGKTTRGIADTAGVYTAKSGRQIDGTWWGRHRGGSVVLPYETMSLDEIAALPVDTLAERAAHLYVWTTNRFLEETFRIVRGWGFKSKPVVLTWGKTPMGKGFGGAFTSTSEFVLFARRGALPHLEKQDSTWWHWSRPYENGHIAHSAKPEAFLDMVECVSPAPRLEMFARRNRLGWDTWGNEALNHVEVAAGGRSSS